MKRIVVPINHDAASLMAADTAALISGSVGSAVDLLYVRESEHVVDAEARLMEARARFADFGVNAEIHRVDGSKADRIVQLSAAADLVVMRNRTRVRSTDPKDSVSPTTLEVIKSAQCPVLVCTERRTDLHNPLFAYNGSRQSRNAVTKTIELLAPPLVRRGTVAVVTSDEHMAERLFGEISEIAAQQGVELSYYWSPGKPGDVILGYLEERGAEHDLIVMGAFGRNWFRERIFGSTTEAILRMASVPVLLAR